MSQPDEGKTSYPECEKLLSLDTERQAIMEFVLWLADAKEAHIAIYQGNHLMPMMVTTDDLIYEFLGVDKDKLEKERLSILRELDQHAAQETTPSHPQAGISGAV